MGKTVRHKGENTFRFQSFSERIANVNIDVIHRIKAPDDEPEDTKTYFGAALEKWTEFNCTAHFTNFRQEISGQVQTFPQLVHHEEVIVSALKKHLRVPDSLAYEPLLDLMVQLARDLQSDFYKYFRDVFDVLLELLDSHPQDSDLLEKAFTSLSYLFKFLWRYLIKDIKDVFSYFSPLLAWPYKNYIRRFAAESFAFLMRKVKDTGDLLDTMFLSLQHKPNQAQGIGLLLFEMLKGVCKQFHSTSTRLFPVVLSKLGPTASDGSPSTVLPWSLVQKSLSHMIQSILAYGTAQNVETFLETLEEEVKLLERRMSSTKTESDQKQNEEHLIRCLDLMKVWLDFKNTTLVAKPENLAQVLLLLMKSPSFPNSIGEIALPCLSSLLVNAHDRLSIETTVKLIAAVFKTKLDHQILFTFMESLYDSPLFEKDILPHMLQYCHRMAKNEKTRQVTLHHLLRTILHKCPLLQDGKGLEQYNTYILDFGSVMRSDKKKAGVVAYISSLIKQRSKSWWHDSQEEVWAALVCLPHIRPLQKKDALIKCITAMINEIQNNLQTVTLPFKKDESLFMLSQCVETLMALQDGPEFYSSVDSSWIMELSSEYSDRIYQLRLLDLFLTRAVIDERNDILTRETFDRLASSLVKNLSSPYPKIRLLTLRILSHFDLVNSSKSSQDGNSVSVFRICLEAEQIPLTVHDYRAKLLYLRKLDGGYVFQNITASPAHQKVPLRYLIGCLYNNMKMLWEPVKSLITSHAKTMAPDVFWEIFQEHLYFVNDQIVSGIKDAPMYDHASVQSYIEQRKDRSPLAVKFLQERFSIAVLNKNCLPDFIHFRSQLWQLMQQFPEKCEPRSQDLSTLFLLFLRNEYYRHDIDAAKTQDIRKDDAKSDADDSMENEDDDEEDEEDEEEEENDDDDDDEQSEEKEIYAGSNENQEQITLTSRTSMLKGKKTLTTLIIKLKLFAKFQNPRHLHLESELKDMYLQLLMHSDADVQQVAFSCLMTYKYKYLTPYRANFDRLLDNKTFKNELVLFSIDETAGVIGTDHRGKLLPVLMRILYGKMHSKAIKDTYSNKGHSNARRAIVFRFLAGCGPSELQPFVDLIFEPCKDFISDDLLGRLQEIKNGINLSKVLSLKRIRSILDTVNIICDKLGHLLQDFMPSLLQILLGISALCGQCLDSRDDIRPAAISSLKALRQMALVRIKEFFINFENYSFTAVELDGIFASAVWPRLDKLPMEGVYSPTAMLRLFHMWSGYPRFLPLLGKCHPENPSLTPLPYIFDLLLVKEAKSTVTSFILEMVENLLSEPDVPPDMDAGDSAMPVTASIITLNHDEMADIASTNTIGIRLLIPHIPKLLEHIEAVMKHLTKKPSQPRELKILARISRFVTDPDQCAKLIQLLLPFLSRRGARSQDMEIDMLNSIASLIRMTTNPQQFYRPLCKVFSSVHHIISRNVVCEIFTTLGDLIPKYSDISSMMTELNSWDKRHMDEPDYKRRLDAFRVINAAVTEMTEVDVDYLLPIIHNTCYFIIYLDDLSIRDNANHTLVTIVTQLAAIGCTENVFKELITNGIMSEVKSGIRRKKEVVRHEFFTILAGVIRAFPTHRTFSDLLPLLDEDPNADFFEGIRHIQYHQRAKAMRRLRELLLCRKFNMETLTSYCMPLPTMFLFEPAYEKAQSLIETSIFVVGAICKQLPWQYYSHQMKRYLELLPKSNHQKIVVKIIVVILNAFHFDLSASQFKMGRSPQTDKQTNDEKSVEIEKAAQEHQVPEQQEEDESMVIDDVIENGEKMENEVNDPMLEKKLKPGLTICNVNQATRIHSMVMRSLLPQLHRTLAEKAKSEDAHKLARSNYAENVEIMRVPIALAMVKLLQHMPHGALEIRLPSILIKVCNFLKSRSKDIRETARATLIKIALSLGHKYLPYILHEMKTGLTRGYQVHVLCFTVHALLVHLSPTLKHGDLDHCITLLNEVFKSELFGEAAEEKEVNAIAAKVVEARSSKSYDSYKIVARFIGTKSIGRLISPLKQVLDSTHSHKTAKKVEKVLNNVALGLLDNKDLDIETLMIFIHGLTSDTVRLINTEADKSKGRVVEAEESAPGLRPPSCLLLTSAPPRGGIKPKTSKKTNLHILVEFGLQLLQMCLKHSRLVATEHKHIELLDPFIHLLSQCLTARHVKITSVTLRCLQWLLKFPLPTLKVYVKAIANSMFVLLKNYATAGSAKGDNLELVSMCFKTVTILVRNVKYYPLTHDQLRVLATFCEEDIHDYNRQSTAFTLLKSILSRKVEMKEIHELIDKVAKLSVTSDSAHTRLQCRQVVLQYLLDYRLSKKMILSRLQFCLAQLEYEYESGRESGLEMIATILSTFPQACLVEYSGMMFVPMSVALANDQSTKCRKLTALAIKSLLEKVDQGSRNRLFSITVSWLQEKRVLHRILGAQLCGLFVEVESAQFLQHLPTILPIIHQQLEPGMYQQKSSSDAAEHDVDRLLFNVLTLLLKIFRECNVIIRGAQWSEQMRDIWVHIESHILYPHIWVEYTVDQLYGMLFAAWSPSELAGLQEKVDDEEEEGGTSSGDEASKDYLVANPKKKLSSLAFDFCSQFQSPLLDNALAEQIIKNMIFITKTAKLMQISTGELTPQPLPSEEQPSIDRAVSETLSSKDNRTSQTNDQSKEERVILGKLTVKWLVRKMVKEANHEAIHNVRVSIKRTNIYKWMAAVSMDLGRDYLPSVLQFMLAPLQRELNDKAIIKVPELSSLAQEVLRVLKSCVGVDTFTHAYSNVQKFISERREEFRRKRAVAAVAYPEAAIRRKQKRHAAKKEAKKRKIQILRPEQGIKKRRLLAKSSSGTS